MSAPAAGSRAKRLFILRVLLKLMAWLALLVVLWIAFRFVFNFPAYDNRRDKTIPVQQLKVGESLETEWAGRKILVYKKSSTDFFVIDQRSPEFSCLLHLIDNEPVGNGGSSTLPLLEDSCTGDVFDLDGMVLPGQRATRNLQPLRYEINSKGALLLLR